MFAVIVGRALVYVVHSVLSKFQFLSQYDTIRRTVSMPLTPVTFSYTCSGRERLEGERPWIWHTHLGEGFWFLGWVWDLCQS